MEGGGHLSSKNICGPHQDSNLRPPSLRGGPLTNRAIPPPMTTILIKMSDVQKQTNKYFTRVQLETTTPENLEITFVVYLL